MLLKAADTNARVHRLAPHEIGRAAMAAPGPATPPHNPHYCDRFLCGAVWRPNRAFLLCGCAMVRVARLRRCFSKDGEPAVVGVRGIHGRHVRDPVWIVPGAEAGALP